MGGRVESKRKENSRVKTKSLESLVVSCVASTVINFHNVEGVKHDNEIIFHALRKTKVSLQDSIHY